MASNVDFNAIAAVLPMRIADINREILQGTWRPQMQEYTDWWNGFAAQVFKTLVDAKIDPIKAVEIIFSDDFPRPGQVQESELQLVGSASSIVEKKSGFEATVSLAFAGLANIGLGGGFHSDTDQTVTTTAQSTYRIKTGPAGSPRFTADMLAALASANFPVLPTLPPPTQTPLSGGSTAPTKVAEDKKP